MIDVFTRNLPAHLALEIQKQYEGFLPIFNSYINSESDHYSSLKNRENFNHFILGLAIFYKSVIIPLREASSCFYDLRQKDVTGIRIGKYLFTSNDTRKIEKMYSDLRVILDRNQVSEHLLLFSDIKDFARNLNSYLKN